MPYIAAASAGGILGYAYSRTLQQIRKTAGVPAPPCIVDQFVFAVRDVQGKLPPIIPQSSDAHNPFHCLRGYLKN